MSNSAVLDKSRQYRYQLTRAWHDGEARNPLVWVMLNPSTADETQDDPTIRRVIRFTGDAGCDALVVVNLYPIRARDPKEAYAAVSEYELTAANRENREHIRQVFSGHSNIVAAWGSIRPIASHQVRFILEAAKEAKCTTWCLGLTKFGHPRHPLYVPASQKLVPFVGLGEPTP